MIRWESWLVIFKWLGKTLTFYSYLLREYCLQAQNERHIEIHGKVSGRLKIG